MPSMIEPGMNFCPDFCRFHSYAMYCSSVMCFSVAGNAVLKVQNRLNPTVKF